MSLEQFAAFRERVSQDSKLQSAVSLQRLVVEEDGDSYEIDALGAVGPDGQQRSLMDLGADYGYAFSAEDVQTALGIGQEGSQAANDGELSDFELALVQAASGGGGFGNCVLPGCPTGCPPEGK